MEEEYLKIRISDLQRIEVGQEEKGRGEDCEQKMTKTNGRIRRRRKINDEEKRKEKHQQDKKAKVKEKNGGTLGDRRRREEERNKKWKTTLKMKELELAPITHDRKLKCE